MSCIGMDEIQKTQRSFARKAEREPEHRFEDLYHLLYRKEWVEAALDKVLGNPGSRTAGVDGITRQAFAKAGYRERFVAELRADIRAGTYRPQPVRRHWIPKADGRKRPLGIPVIRDRVVQMMLKMLLEPIWESDFLPCSHGFRPERRTMDCIAQCFRLIYPQKGYYWVIEGDITGCFDHIQHEKLLELVARRVADVRVLKLIRQMLEAGVMEGELFKKTEGGTPQGGIVSPLLANIYLHELDLWWWRRWGKLSRGQRCYRRRVKNESNAMLVRYADDFILLYNGTKSQAEEIRAALRTFLDEELHLELNEEKTRLAHATDGFDFLGFNVRLYEDGEKKPHLRVKPSAKNVQRFRAQIRQMTCKRRVFDPEIEKIQAINQLCRGWVSYYQHVSAKETARELDYWVFLRVLGWFQRKHRKGPRWVWNEYVSGEKTEHHDRTNIGVCGRDGQTLHLCKMTDQPITLYRQRKHQNPYLESGCATGIQNIESDSPLALQTWIGWTRHNARAELRAEALKRDGHRCARCGATENLVVHHKKPWARGGDDELENLETLCQNCHHQEPVPTRGTGRRKRQSRDATSKRRGKAG